VHERRSDRRCPKKDASDHRITGAAAVAAVAAAAATLWPLVALKLKEKKHIC
jgi:hypothetical protein